jgi:hypothetical protein
MSLIIIMGIAYSLVITFHTLGPFLIQNTLAYSPVFFGHLALCFGLAFLLATFICRWLLKRYQAITLLAVLIHLLFFLGIVLLLLSFVINNNIIFISLVSALMFLTAGFIFPLAMGKGLSLFKSIAGTAGATMYLVNVLITSLVSFLISFIHVEQFSTLMVINFLLLTSFFIVYWLGIKNNKE